MYKFSLHKLSLTLSLATSGIFTSSCMSTTGGTNMQTEHEASRREEVNYTKLEEYLSTTTENLSKARGKDFVLVLGNTDAGKSTLIKFLQGHYFELFEDMEEEERILRCTENPNITFPSPKLGDRFNACTLFPEIYNVTEDLLCCDTAGFGETRGLTEEILTYLAVQMAIKAARSVKAVVAVVEESQLTSQKGAGFKSIISAVLSLFRGDSYQPSFHLLVNKGTKSRTALLSTMAKMQASMGAMADKEKNETKAREYAGLEAILAIFAKTRNVHPLRPYKEESRAYFLDLLQKSAPIPSDCLGMMRDSKYGQVVDRLLCDIAMEGLSNIKSIQSVHETLIDLTLDAKSDLEKKAESKSLALEHQTSIAIEEEKIQQQIFEISQKEEQKEREEAFFHEQEGSLNERRVELQLNEENIQTTESDLTNGRASLINTYELETREEANVRAQQSEIDRHNATIAAKNSNISTENVVINQLNGCIHTEQAKVDSKRSTLSNPSALDATSEVRVRISYRDSKQQDYERKKTQTSNTKTSVDSISSKLNAAENDTTFRNEGFESWAEKTFYPKAKQGTRNKKDFSHYASGTVRDLVAIGTGAVSEGAPGYFENSTRSGRTASTTYWTPTHVFGEAIFFVNVEIRHTPDGISKINNLRNELNTAKSNLSTYERERDALLNEYNTAYYAVDTERQNVRNRLNAEIQNCVAQINAWNTSITNANSRITQHRQEIAAATSGIETARANKQLSEQNLDHIRRTRQENSMSTQDFENILAGYRATIVSLQNQIEDINTSLSNSRMAISNAEAEIRNSITVIENSRNLIGFYEESIADLESSMQNLEDHLISLRDRLHGLVGTLGEANQSLESMQKSKKLRMLETICEIMQPKLETVDEFRELYKLLPELLERVEALIQNAQQSLCF